MSERNAVMLTRFLSISLLSLSSSLLGVACNRPSEVGESGASASSSAVLTIPDPAHQWDSLISGNPGLPPSVSALLRNGADEEALARNPRVSLEEHLPATVSQARHQRLALEHYRQALELLVNDYPAVQKRIRQKTAVLSLSLESLDDLNRRLFPPR
ncbi:MAG TPA: hypothetical protein VLJ37_01760 [bacterium]|nr:hypothetical protein [bacterium]